MVVLDTDHLSLLERADSEEGGRIRARLQQVPPEERATTIVNFEEQMRGWMAVLARARTLAQEVEVYRRLRQQLANYTGLVVLEFDERAATEYQRLRNARLRVGTMDLKIAAIVLAQGATLLSRNLSDFGRIPGLTVEDWTV
jgi:tRNA(fMet)-specific endonuclease VapC